MDLNSNVFRIVRSITDEKTEKTKRAATFRTAGKVGGNARARTLTPERRREIAVKVSRARWRKTG
jgi:hypothetical protein